MPDESHLVEYADEASVSQQMQSCSPIEGSRRQYYCRSRIARGILIALHATERMSIYLRKGSANQEAVTCEEGESLHSQRMALMVGNKTMAEGGGTDQEMR